MRLWHYDLLDKLSKQRLMGQHREICALKGLGWNKKHSTIDYIKKYNFLMLHNYHKQVMGILINKYHVAIDITWYNEYYRGKRIGFVSKLPNNTNRIYKKYPEHNESYMQECIDNLKRKGVKIIV